MRRYVPSLHSALRILCISLLAGSLFFHCDFAGSADSSGDGAFLALVLAGGSDSGTGAGSRDSDGGTDEGPVTPPVLPGLPPPPPGACVGAIDTGIPIGDCGQHCIETNLVGNQFQATARFIAPDDGLYAFVDVGFANPEGTPVGLSSLVEGFGPSMDQEFTADSIPLNTDGYAPGCINVSSVMIFDDGVNYSSLLLEALVLVP